MSRLVDKIGAGYGSATHLLWLATMGFKETYFTLLQNHSNNVIYNNGLRFLAIDVLTRIKEDNNKNSIS